MPDYGLGLVQPSMINQQLAQGVQTGIGLGEARVAAMDRQLLLERQAQADAAAKAQQEAAMASRQAYIASGEDVINSGFKPEKVAAHIARFPEAAKHYADVVKMMDQTTKRNHFQNAVAVFSIAKNDPIKGAEYAEKLAAAAKDTPGQEKQAEALLRVAGQIRENPGGALLQTASFISEAADTPKEFAEVFDRISASDATLTEAKAKAGQAQAEQKIKDIQAETEREKILASIALDKANAVRLYRLSDLEAERIGIAKEEMRIAAEKELRDAAGLSKDSQKMVVEAAVDAAAASAEQSEITKIASLFDEKSAPMLNGGFSAAGGFASRTTGVSTEEQQARDKYEAVVDKMITASFKGQGDVSEGERESKRRAYPSRNAPFSVIKKFLDGEAGKIEGRRQRRRAEIEYIKQNGDIGPAAQPMVVGGVEVMPGETFDDALVRIENSK